jgi:hypothetical protein
MNIKEFIGSKLDNLINWIISNDILSEQHSLIIELKNKTKCIDEFIKDITILNVCADKEGNVSNDICNIYLKKFDLRIYDFMEQDIAKFKRYLQCFILAIRQDIQK